MKIYVCNVMTQPGETDGYTASAHVRALLHGAEANVCDIVVVNDELPRKLRERTPKRASSRCSVDEDDLGTLGVRVVRANVISETDTVRHDSDRLAAVVVGIINDAVAERACYVRFRPGPRPGARVVSRRERSRDQRIASVSDVRYVGLCCRSRSTR